MTISEYIKDKLSGFGVDLTATGIDSLLIDQGLVGSTTYDQSQIVPVKKAIYGFIPELLVRPSVSEGDYSIKYDIAGIKAYYSILCKDLNLTDQINSKPKISSASTKW